MTLHRSFTVLTALAVMLLLAAPASGQVGEGLADLNSMPEAALAALPGVTPTIAKAFVSARSFAGNVEANAFLLSQNLTQDQANAIYATAFVHVNLNTGTSEEILLIPGAGNRMAHEFEEYRPWRTWAQFDREISKYVGQEETDRLKQYVFIPVNLNTATDEDILSVPGAGNRMVREFKEYRPWKAKAQFDREISKYVGDEETQRLWRYVVIE